MEGNKYDKEEDSKVEIIEFINDDGWARDSGAIFLLNHEKFYL